MPHQYNQNMFPRVEGLDFLSSEDVDEAFEIIEEEKFWLIREYYDLINRMETTEARRVFNPDHTVNWLMLYLTREVMSNINQLIDNWNVFIDLREIEMSGKIIMSEMSIEQAAEARDIDELYADRLRDLYTLAKREWAREFRSYMIILTWQQAIFNATAGIV
ncbi:unnamed protein product [Aureobasidium mustum]|uniref:Uncharacterized protein n=1 Tax=Aureobasidium mustum TaxID=2773714 RepID=A0A9N8JZY5_9PEZI|nr:unnamed protein product [Aureobasidium mustum]